MQWQHGLKRPSAVDVVPVMPGDFVGDHDQRQQPADRTFGAVASISKEQKEQVQNNEKSHSCEMEIPQILEGGALKVFSEEIDHAGNFTTKYLFDEFSK
jgi:hypothetical protein